MSYVPTHGGSGALGEKAGFAREVELLNLSMSSFPYPAKQRIPVSFSFMFLSNCHSMDHAPQDSKDTFKGHSKTVALQNVFKNVINCNKKIIT